MRDMLQKMPKIVGLNSDSRWTASTKFSFNMKLNRGILEKGKTLNEFENFLSLR
jgi:hypothetical protein